MNSRKSMLGISTLIVLFIVSCATPAVPASTATMAPDQPEVVVADTPLQPEPAITAELTPQSESLTESPSAETPQVVVTSRGPDLHASAPGDVNLASGGLQLVEFFRFT